MFARRLRKKAQEPQPEQFGLYDRLGLRLLLDRSSLVDRTIIETGEWESEQIEYLFSVAKSIGARDMIFLDVGAYFGLYSMLALRSGLFREVYAFEPDRHNFAHLQATLLLNDAAHAIHAINAAAYSSSTMVDFMDSRHCDGGNRAGSGIVAAGTSASYSVRAVALDDVIDIRGATIVAKIDVEGHEASALMGAERMVRANKLLAQIEIFDAHARATIAETERLGLRRVQSIGPDWYMSNAN